jgi:hypothetical protein
MPIFEDTSQGSPGSNPGSTFHLESTDIIPRGINIINTAAIGTWADGFAGNVPWGTNGNTLQLVNYPGSYPAEKNGFATAGGPVTVADLSTIFPCYTSGYGFQRTVTDVAGSPTWHSTGFTGGGTGVYNVICTPNGWAIN